jgi:hypothetical protein
MLRSRSDGKSRLPMREVITAAFLCFSFLFFSSVSNEKPGTEEVIITGLRFDKDRTDVFSKTPKQPAFTIDKKGVLRPTKDYQIIYVKSDKVLVLLPKTTSYSSYKQLGGYDEIELPGGDLVACMCDARDNCRFDNSKKEFEFVCTGSCGCYIGVLFNYSNPPFQYETPGGRWFNF